MDEGKLEDMNAANARLQGHFRDHECDAATCPEAARLYADYLVADSACYGIDHTKLPGWRNVYGPAGTSAGTLSAELAEALERERKHVATNSQAVSACERAQRELAEAVGLLRGLELDHVGKPDDINHAISPEPGHCPACRVARFLAKVKQ